MNTILYIEDNFANRLLIQRLLEAHNYNLLQADTGTDGIALAQKYHPDLILLDLGLPDLDGDEVVKLLRQIPEIERTPIVAVTAWPKQMAQQKSIEYGCDDCITKPINIATFPKQIAEFLKN